MIPPQQTTRHSMHMPPILVGAVLVLCVLPLLLHVLGVNFGSQPAPLDAFSLTAESTGTVVNALHQVLRGSVTHTILEWSALCIAFFTIVLTYIHVSITRDTTTLIIGVALFCAGVMDAFHALAADHLMTTMADNQNLIPFTWAVSRLFKGLIVIASVGILAVVRTNRWQGKPCFVVLGGLIFGLCAYGIMRFVVSSVHPPQMVFPDAMLTRPYDVALLVLFVVAGTLVYPLLYRRAPSLFSSALMISVIPDVATQLHMSFGSTALFDAHFHIAHFLKILAYLVPLSGVVFVHMRTCCGEARAVAQLETGQGTQTDQAGPRDGEPAVQVPCLDMTVKKPANEELPQSKDGSRLLVTPQALHENRRRLHVLLAEDNVVNQKLGARFLEKRGHTVVLASTGREALDVLQQQHCDLVLMDVQMPDMDGLEATAAIRAQEQISGGHMPIVAMTANAMEDDRNRCLQAGMDAYVAKPFKPFELMATIEALVPQASTDEAQSEDEQWRRENRADPPGNGESTVIFDWDEGLRHVEGDEELYKELIVVFRDGVSLQLEDLHQALQIGDIATVEREAHSLHGAAINIGARAVSEVARSIEHAIRHREMGTVPQLYNRLTSAVADTMVSLNDYVRGEPAAQAEQTTAGIATELTILVVDDAPINIAILDKALTREGYRVLTACSGPQARQLAITHQPDLIILDVMMPGEDGFDVMRQLKGDARTTAIPVIFLTGKDDVESKVEGFALGAVDYITKPFYPPEVKARVQLHLKLHRATSALLASQAEKLMQLHEAQTSLLVSPSDLPEAQFGVHYASLLEAGGDFYDVLRISTDIFGYFVADVSGHDIRTSFLTSALKALLKQNSAPIYKPVETLGMINSVLLELLPEGKFLTACYARLNRKTNTMTIVNAGHPPLLYMPCHGQPRLIELSGDVLGIFKDVCHEPQDIKVEKGDRFFLYSDGLIERPGRRQSWAPCLAQLLELCKQVQGIDITDTATLLTNLMHDQGDEPEDDIVVLGIEV